MKYAFFLAAGICFVLAGWLGVEVGIAAAGAAAVLGCVCIWQAMKDEGTLSLKLAKTSENEERDALQKEYFQKAVHDYNTLQHMYTQLDDLELQAQVQKMQGIASNFLYYLQKNPEKIGQARQFIDRYQHQAVLLLQKYQELTETGLTTEQVVQIKDNIKHTLQSFDEAYEAEFTAVLNAQIMDIDAELHVMRQTMEADGITDRSGAQSDAKDGRQGRTRVFEQTETAAAARRKRDTSDIPDGLGWDVLKTKCIAAILAIFLGSFGAHKFYLGKTFQGVLHILFCWTMIPGIIGIVEGVRYLFMQRKDFYYQYYMRQH